MQSHETHILKRRSRSPLLDVGPKSIRKRSRSPQPHQHHHHRSHRPSSHSNAPQQPLPFGAIPLRRHDFETYKPMFSLYLDIQKQLVLEDLGQDEVKGRWKSFMGKWNHGDLAEGWYDPATLHKAQTSATADCNSPTTRSRPKPSPRPSPPKDAQFEEKKDQNGDDASSEDDAIGPALPGQELHNPTPKARGRDPGPSIPNTQDLALRRELESEDREQSRLNLHHERKADRQIQKSRLEELVPRAEAGSKERMMEKKREKADANRAFASVKGDAVGGVEEVGEADLMGGDDDGIEGLKKRKVVEERKKNERELRKEEILRARREEREERVRAYQEREEKTMSGLVALARARFG